MLKKNEESQMAIINVLRGIRKICMAKNLTEAAQSDMDKLFCRLYCAATYFGERDQIATAVYN